MSTKVKDLEGGDYSKYQTFWKYLVYHAKSIFQQVNEKLGGWVTKDNFYTVIAVIVILALLMGNITLVVTMIFGIDAWTTPHYQIITICAVTALADIALVYLDYILGKRQFLGIIN